jgi:hypothetical protein
VQGHSPTVKSRGIRFLAWLVAAYVAASTLVVFVLSELAPVVSRVLQPRGLLIVLVVACLAGVLVDVRAINSRWVSLGLRRQTPKTLLYMGEHAWITPFIWGFDTGLIWTTYRVSFSSWVLLLMAMTGFAPPWSGAVYGLVFAGPLVGTMLLAGRLGSWARSLRSMVPAQTVGVITMAGVAAFALAGLAGNV